MKKAKVFEETYSNYLSEIAKLDLKKRAQGLGAEFSNDKLIIPFLNNTYSVAGEGLFGIEGSFPTFAVKVLLCTFNEDIQKKIIKFKKNPWGIVKIILTRKRVIFVTRKIIMSVTNV